MSEAKLNARQERFAQLVAAGSHSQTDAYCVAYNKVGKPTKSTHEAASRLAANVKVMARIVELRAPLIETAGLTFSGHLERLKTLSEKAEKAGAFSAATAAEVARGRAAGYYAERVRMEDLDKLTEDELEMVSRGKVPARLKLA